MKEFSESESVWWFVYKMAGDNDHVVCSLDCCEFDARAIIVSFMNEKHA